MSKEISSWILLSVPHGMISRAPSSLSHINPRNERYYAEINGQSKKT